jgi:hypothetical protein
MATRPGPAAVLRPSDTRLEARAWRLRPQLIVNPRIVKSPVWQSVLSGPRPLWLLSPVQVLRSWSPARPAQRDWQWQCSPLRRSRAESSAEPWPSTPDPGRRGRVGAVLNTSAGAPAPAQQSAGAERGLLQVDPTWGAMRRRERGCVVVGRWVGRSENWGRVDGDRRPRPRRAALPSGSGSEFGSGLSRPRYRAGQTRTGVQVSGHQVRPGLRVRRNRRMRGQCAVAAESAAGREIWPGGGRVPARARRVRRRGPRGEPAGPFGQRRLSALENGYNPIRPRSDSYFSQPPIPPPPPLPSPD